MKRGLGKGLDALFEDSAADASQSGGTVTLKITEIEPNKGQPRKSFNEEALRQLADSIKQNGILQPLLVRPIKGESGYQLVAGERRWRAARMAGISQVPVIIKELNDQQVMAVALIENLQREDLNPVEEAEGYKQLMDSYNLTQDEVAQKVGKSRPAVTNAMRLLNLPKSVLKMVKNGELSQGHARTLLTLEDEEVIKELADEIINKGLSVRAVEKLVRNAQSDKPPSRRGLAVKVNVVESEVESCLTEILGRKVSVKPGKNKGIIEIEYYGEDDLKALAGQMTHK